MIHPRTTRRPRERPIPDSAPSSYCTGVGRPDANPPPAGSRAARLKADELCRLLAAGFNPLSAAKRVMLTPDACRELLEREAGQTRLML